MNSTSQSVSRGGWINLYRSVSNPKRELEQIRDSQKNSAIYGRIIRTNFQVYQAAYETLQIASISGFSLRPHGAWQHLGTEPQNHRTTVPQNHRTTEHTEHTEPERFFRVFRVFRG